MAFVGFSNGFYKAPVRFELGAAVAMPSPYLKIINAATQKSTFFVMLFNAPDGQRYLPA